MGKVCDAAHSHKLLGTHPVQCLSMCACYSFNEKFLFVPAVCPGVRESSQQVSQVRDSYKWVLNIPSKNLHMSFQEVNCCLSFSKKHRDKLAIMLISWFLCFSLAQVLVDLSSKNDRGLYQARVRAVVGGRPLTFYSLVGLENESFYRSVPRIIALALEALKT